MAISINYVTKVISVPKADTTLIQSVPSEIREMSLSWLHAQLRDWEDDEDNIWMPVTHDYAEPANIGGVTLAQVILLINGYTVTFEDGQYAIDIVGGNSNVGNNVNVNQVSVRSYNSAGLVQTGEIEFASFEGAIWYDSGSSTVGTIYPAGTRASPVNNMDDALLIMTSRGLGQINLLTDVTLQTNDYSGIHFQGRDPIEVQISVDPTATVIDCVFTNASLTGTLDANVTIRDCILNAVSGLNGIVRNTILNAAVFTLGAGTTHILDCWSGVPGAGTPIIDFNGAAVTNLALRGYAGGITLQNKTGVGSVSIDLLSGQIILDNTVDAGELVLRGVGKWTNEGTYSGTATVFNELNNFTDIQTLLTTTSNTLSEATAAKIAALAASTDAGDAEVAALAAEAAANQAISDIAALVAPDNASIQEIYRAHFNRRKWDKIAKTVTLYQDNKIGIHKVFDTNDDLSELTPQ